MHWTLQSLGFFSRTESNRTEPTINPGASMEQTLVFGSKTLTKLNKIYIFVWKVTSSEKGSSWVQLDNPSIEEAFFEFG